MKATAATRLTVVRRRLSACSNASSTGSRLIWPTSRELLHTLGDDDPGCRLDQCEVRERLREVAEVVTGVHVELLGEEPVRGGDPKQAFHQVTGKLLLADDRQRGHQPERADQERSFLAGQAVVGL